MTDTSRVRQARAQLVFALDFPSLADATATAQRVKAHVGVLKVGLELFIKEGPAAVRAVRDWGCDAFLDLKLHDIEKTVERAVGTASQLGAKYLTVHASGGPGMLEAAATRAQQEGAGLQILAVTVLTSLDQKDLRAIGVAGDSSQAVTRLARLAAEAGVSGLVCSSQEVAGLRQLLGPKPLLVTPGIRPSGAALGDQKRVGTPADAIRAGSSLLVVGRPIRDAADPEAAAREIVQEIARS